MTEFFSNDTYKFIFIHIPKTGGTSVKKILSDKIKIDGFSIKGENVKYTKSTHIGINLEQYIKYNNYFKFVFVRHPYDWIKSYYNFHSNKNKFYSNINIKNINNTININFDEWLNSLNNFNQTDYFIKEDKILVDKICKLENFNEEMVFILNKLNINNEFTNIKLKDSLKHKINTINELTVEQKMKIQKICKKDFQYLNYEF